MKKYQYRSSWLFRVAGSLLIAFGLLITLVGVTMRGEDDIWLKIVLAGVFFLGVGVLIIELIGDLSSCGPRRMVAKMFYR